MSSFISNQIIPSGNRYYTIKEYEFNGRKVPIYFFLIRDIRTVYGNEIASILQSNSGIDLMKVRDPRKGKENGYANVVWVRDDMIPEHDGFQLLHLDTYVSTESQEDEFFVNPIDPLNAVFTGITFHRSNELNEDVFRDTLQVIIPIPFCSLGLTGRFEYVRPDSEKYSLFSMINDDNAMKNTLSFTAEEFKQ